MLRIGILGAGHLGKTHLRIVAKCNFFELVGFYDPNKKNVDQLLEEQKYIAFDSPKKLIEAVDVVSIITPTITHFEMAKLALEAKKHVFIEKPIAITNQESNILINLASQNGLLGQVGHVERFNPAFEAVRTSIKDPMFIETNRLSEFNPRGTDVSVILDLMIHDIDIILSIVKSPIKRIDATGVAVISETSDICNAHISFENGCVANLTASRISLKKVRKTRFFQKDGYISIDYLTQKVEVVKIKDVTDNIDDLSVLLTNAEGKKKQIYFENPKINSHNAIEKELDHFSKCILTKKNPLISLKDGARALEVANLIIQCIINKTGS
ncbi:MAG: oxidoreductase [Flavobacteriaceae bacterium]|nr:oxidoreductase [Flavobacteriaceae bacterium]